MTYKLTRRGGYMDHRLWHLDEIVPILCERDLAFLKMLGVGEFMSDVDGNAWIRIS